jgi:hypothetical protein
MNACRTTNSHFLKIYFWVYYPVSRVEGNDLKELVVPNLETHDYSLLFLFLRKQKQAYAVCVPPSFSF